MKSSKKQLSPILVFALAVACMVLAVFSQQRVSRTAQSLNIERYNRMNAEEQLQGAQSKIKSLETNLESTREQLEDIKEELKQKKRVVLELKTEADKMTKLKNILEMQLKDALVSSP